MNKSRSLKYNIIFSSLISFVELFFSTITFPYVARVLLPDSLGQVDFANTTVTYFILLSTFGIAEYGAREIGLYRDNLGKLKDDFSKIVTFRLFSSLLLFLVFILAVAPFYGHGSPYFWLASLSILLSIFNFTWALEAFEAYDALAVARFITRGLLLICVFLFVKSPSDAIIYLGLQIAADFLYFIFSYLKLRHIFHFNFNWWRLLISYRDVDIHSLFRIFTLNLAQASVASMPIFVLGYLKKFELIGFFSSSNRFFWLAYYLIIPASNVLIKKSYALQAGESSHRSHHRNMSLNGLLFIGTPVTLGLYLTADEVVKVFVGDAYFPSVLGLKILSLLVPLYVLNSFWGMQVLFTERREKILVYTYALGAVVNLFLNIFVAHLNLQVGAALSLIISNALICIILGFFAREYYSMGPIKKDVFKIIIACVFMFSVVTAVETLYFEDSILHKLVLKVTFGVLSYGVSIVLLRHTIASKIFVSIREKVFGG